MSDQGSNHYLSVATANLRETAKWVLSSLAVIFALILGGSPLTSLGSIEPHIPRFWVGILGIFLALVSIGIMFWSCVVVLMSRTIDFDELATSNGFKKIRESLDKHLKWNYPPNLGSLKEIYERFATNQKKWRSARQEEQQLADAELQQLEPIVEIILRQGAFEQVRRQFRLMCLIVCVMSIPATIGTILYAWAANPGKDSAKDVEHPFIKTFNVQPDAQELLKK